MSLVRTSLRCARRGYSTHVWSDFSKRPESLKIIDPKFKDAIFEGINPEVGPQSLAQRERRLAYHSPVAIDDTFKLAYELLEADSAKIYSRIDTLRQEGGSARQIERLMAEAEQYNPEVLFNVDNFADQVDRDHPVYRQYLRQKWESHDRMLVMQRLEQLHVIPDTMPTLTPRAEVKVKFPHNTTDEFSGWIEPGTVLPLFATSKPPTVQVQEFERVAEGQLYTIVVVNPDTPHLPTNTFATTLHYAMVDMPLTNADNTIDVRKALGGHLRTVQEYVPLVPEKNSPTQRACLWVFRQTGGAIGGTVSDLDAEAFDIRLFAQQHGLKAVGAHVWRQHFDRLVNAVRKEYGMGAGRVFHRVRRPNPVVAAGYSNVVEDL